MEEDYVLYPTITAEFPGVDLARDKIGPTVADAVEPHGSPEDAAALNAGILECAVIIDAHADKIAHRYDNDDDDGIIAVRDLPPPHLAYDDAIRIETDEHETKNPTKTTTTNPTTMTMTMTRPR